MPKKSVKTRINEQKRYYLELFNDIDENKKQFVMPLIDRLAFFVVSAEDLEELVSKEGYSVPYDNGGGQVGIRENPNSKAQRECAKHIEVITKQLTDLVPPAEKKSKLEMFLDEE